MWAGHLGCAVLTKLSLCWRERGVRPMDWHLSSVWLWVRLRGGRLRTRYKIHLTNPTMHWAYIYHNAPFCNRNVHMCAHFCYKMVHCVVWNRGIVGYGTGALWDLYDRSIGTWLWNIGECLALSNNTLKSNYADLALSNKTLKSNYADLALSNNTLKSNYVEQYRVNHGTLKTWRWRTLVHRKLDKHKAPGRLVLAKVSKTRDWLLVVPGLSQ